LEIVRARFAMPGDFPKITSNGGNGPPSVDICGLTELEIVRFPPESNI
jgi:hypothetical protein